MRPKILPPVILVMVLVLSDCSIFNSSEPSKCGDLVNPVIQQTHYQIFKDSVLYSMNYHYNPDTKRTTVSFYSSVYEDICPYEHVKVSFQLLLDDKNLDLDIVPTARADWYPLFGAEVPLEFKRSSISEYYGILSFGLEQTYHENPGMFYVSWTLTFPSQDSRQSDLIWLNNRVFSVNFDMWYYMFL